GQMREQLQRLDETLASLHSAFDAEGQDRATSFGQILFRQRAIGARFETGVVDPGDVLVALEELCNCQSVLGVSLHAQRQRLQALEEQERIERADGRPEVAQTVYSALD